MKPSFYRACQSVLRIFQLYVPALFCSAIIYLNFYSIPSALRGVFIWLPMVFVIVAGSTHSYVLDLEQRIARLEKERDASAPLR
jgi:hypothetical protein